MDETKRRTGKDALAQWNGQPTASQTAQSGEGQSTRTAGNYDALADQARAMTQANKLQNPDLSGMRSNLDQWRDSAAQQASAQIDYATAQGVRDLARARDDAYQDYQQQVRQTYVDEAKARDNQALYSAARGDRGGIGAAQYDAIAASAATNRQTVYQAQTKLASDVARQIADLRAQGEYSKADKALEIGQQYLTQLRAMEKWAAETRLSVEKVNANMDQWLSNYLLDLEKAGVSAGQWAAQQAFQREQFEWTRTKDLWSQENTRQKQVDDRQQQAQKREDSQQKELSSTGLALLSRGLMPSDAQLRALGLSRTQAARYVAKVNQAAV